MNIIQTHVISNLSNSVDASVDDVRSCLGAFGGSGCSLLLFASCRNEGAIFGGCACKQPFVLGRKGHPFLASELLQEA